MREKKGKEQTVGVRIYPEKPEEVPIQFANYIFVNHTEDEFMITLGQAHPPYITGRPLTQEELSDLQNRGLSARIICRIAVSPSKMKDFLDVLNENYRKFSEKRAGAEW